MYTQRIDLSIEETQNLITLIAQKIAALPRELLENTAFIGIQKWGVYPAQRIAAYIEEHTGIHCPVGTLDITMYRDDIGARETLPKIRETAIPFSLDGIHLILVDDVLEKGRTVRAALDAVTDFGRPATVSLAVLIDRGGRELPIQPDFTAEIRHDIAPDTWLQITVPNDR